MKYAAVLKWSEAQHPRDKTGRFTESDFSQLSQDEETAVQNYTRLFRGTNTTLRSLGEQDISKAALPQNTRHMVTHLNTAMASHPLPEATTLFRVAPEKVAATWKVGSTIQDFAYTSTSKHVESMDQITQDIGLTKGQRTFKTVEITIHAPKGLGHVDVNAVLQARQAAKHRYYDQHEVLLPRGTKFTVISKKKNAKGVLEVVLEARGD